MIQRILMTIVFAPLLLAMAVCPLIYLAHVIAAGEKIELIGVFLLGSFCYFLLFSLVRAFREDERILRGNLLEDYEKNHPEYIINGRPVCFKCGGRKILVHILSRAGMEVIREHSCLCGQRLYLSASGESLEKTIKKIKQKKGYAPAVVGR